MFASLIFEEYVILKSKELTKPKKKTEKDLNKAWDDVLTMIKSKKSKGGINNEDAFSVSNMSQVSSKSLFSNPSESDPESESVITSSTNMTSL